MAEAVADLVIRPSTDDDVPAMLAIYSHHIAQGVGELGAYVDEPLREDDLKQRRKTMKKRRLPHLVAEVNGMIAGYAYAVPFRKRPAYRYALKHSIYIHHEHLRAGIGRQLLPALIEACARAGYFQLIGYIDSANEASLRLHEACGFRQVGLLQRVGFKHGHWTDTVLVQRALVEDPTVLPGPWPGEGNGASAPDAR
jgi:L-amino acid N-acyltransferase YncA